MTISLEDKKFLLSKGLPLLIQSQIMLPVDEKGGRVNPSFTELWRSNSTHRKSHCEGLMLTIRNWCQEYTEVECASMCSELTNMIREQMPDHPIFEEMERMKSLMKNLHMPEGILDDYIKNELRKIKGK